MSLLSVETGMRITWNTYLTYTVGIHTCTNTLANTQAYTSFTVTQTLVYVAGRQA